jgi:tetratricopeptide (TPR) repeat protein
MQLRSLYIFLMLCIAGNFAQAQLNKKIFDNQYPEKKNISLYGFNQFRNKLPFVAADSIVNFFLRNNKAAKKVFLSGSFCNWSTDQISMEKNDSGWTAIVKLASGKHLYKFIIDGKWNVDDDNVLTEKDDHGNVNSIYFKTNTVFTLKGFSKTKNIWLAGSFNNWRKNELKMLKTGNGWELPLYLTNGRHLYRFFADGKGYPDPDNNDHVLNEFNEQSSYLLTGSPDYENDLKSFQKVLSFYQKAQNQDSIASMLFKIAITYKKVSDFPHLLEYLQKALSAYERVGNDYGVAKVECEIGYYYADLAVTPKAIEHFHRALSISEHLGKQTEVAIILGKLGQMYLFMRDSINSFSYLQKALYLNRQLGNKSETAFNLWILGDYYFRLSSNIPAAIECMQKAQELFKESGDDGGVAYVLFNLADILLYAPDTALKKVQIRVSEKYIRSIEYQKRGIEIIKYLEPEYGLTVHFLVLSETYEKIGSYDSAYHYYKQYIAIRDKFIGTDKQKEIARLETRYENEKKEDSLKLDKELSDEKLEKQILLSRQEQELQQLVYLKTQADLQNEQLTSREKEKQLTLSEKEKQLQLARLKTLTQEKAITKLNQQRQWIYIIGVFLLLAVGSLYFLYRSRLRSIRLETQLVKEKAAQEKKEIEFQHKLADISMSALRSQMNPHFIFNCLNSIKLYTTQNDTVAATEYLTKFSKLIRLVLENSRNERITLSSELAALELYIEMEAMRFKEKLSYSFKVGKDVETGYIEIPPLLLQPYVENAIWHGLMPKDEGGHIAINVSMHNESLLEINIEDNGIGRVAATALNNKMAGKHRSYGMKATTERIALINQIYKTGANVVTHDLVDEQGQAAGTEVTLQIPV